MKEENERVVYKKGTIRVFFSFFFPIERDEVSLRFR